MRTDPELIVCLKKGDHYAFREAFDLYSKKVFAFSFSFVRNREAAEDITQEVFKRIWEKRYKLDPKKSLHSLFFSITYHCIIDDLRRKKRRAKLVPISAVIQTTAGETADLAASKNLDSLYQQAVNQMPDRRKEIFLLSRHEGLNNNQIASQLNISPKTVENQMTAALRSLKEYFRDIELMLTLFLVFFL